MDFHGRVHLSVVERMGLLEQVRARQTDLGAISYVDASPARNAPSQRYFLARP